MKYLVLVFVALILFNTVNLSFASKENPVYAAKPHFPESVKIGEDAAFSVKVSNTAGTWVSGIAPVIDVNPKSATSFVHITANPSLTVLTDGYSDIIHGTIYVDKGIPVDRIFVSVTFTAKNSRLEQIPLVNPENNASIRIEKESPSTDSMFDLENKKPSCAKPDSKVPRYGCSDVTTIKIDSSLKQIKTGTYPYNVVCDSSLELAQKKGDRMSACVKLETKIELIIREWAQDDRILLGCIGDRVLQCYPNDPKEYRSKLYDYYFGKGSLPSSSDYNFTALHTINACTDKPWICYGELGNGTRIRVSCDYPLHGCGVRSFDNNTENRK